MPKKSEDERKEKNAKRRYGRPKRERKKSEKNPKKNPKTLKQILIVIYGVFTGRCKWSGIEQAQARIRVCPVGLQHQRMARWCGIACLRSPIPRSLFTLRLVHKSVGVDVHLPDDHIVARAALTHTHTHKLIKHPSCVCNASRPATGKCREHRPTPGHGTQTVHSFTRSNWLIVCRVAWNNRYSGYLLTSSLRISSLFISSRRFSPLFASFRLCLDRIALRPSTAAK